MKQELFFLSCMRYLEVKGELPYKITNKHYKSEIYLGAKNGLENSEMVFVFFNKEKPNSTISIAIEENPLKLSPNKILIDLISNEEVDPGYDYSFLYLNNEIYINYNKNEKITKAFIKETNKKIKEAKKDKRLKVVV